MKIEYLGHSCFCLTTENGIKILTDPYTQVGYSLPKGLTVDIVTVSHGHFDHNYLEGVKAKKVVKDTLLYKENGVRIEGISTFHDEKQGALRGKNTIYKIYADGLTVCHLGDLGEKYSETLKNLIGKMDICLIPVGGTYTINAKEAMEYVEKTNPHVVIPMHYRPKDGALDITDAQPFLRLWNKEVQNCLYGEIVLKKDDLQDRETKLVYMERK